MIVEKCSTCNVAPKIELTDDNLKLFFCGTCNKNHEDKATKQANKAAKNWNKANKPNKPDKPH